MRRVPGTNGVLKATRAPKNNVMAEVRRTPVIQRNPGAQMMLEQVAAIIQ